jgi:hypothetical protein
LKTIDIGEIKYHRATEIADEIGISRQTLWRWRRTNKIPFGHRFRDGQIFFSQEEFDAIKEFAFRLEPARPSAASQPGLFDERS